MSRDADQPSHHTVPTPPAVRIPLPSLEELREAAVAWRRPDRRPLVLQLAPKPVTGTLARAFTARALAAEVPDVAADTVLLLLSELVTNAIRHARSPARLELAIDGRTVRVEVIDGSPQPPRLSWQSATPTGESGRGLFLVEALADRWGHELLELGKRVWFELDLPSCGNSSQ